MNMNWGNQGNQFEKPAVEPYDGVIDTASLDEISRQLFAQGREYEKVTGDLRVGDLVNLEYAENLKKTLADFSNRLHKESKATAEAERLSKIVKERIQTLDELLKVAKTSH